MILIYSEDLKVKKIIKLPESKSDFMLKSISVTDNVFIITDDYKNTFLFKDSKLTKLTKQVVIEDIKIELIDKFMFINGSKTEVKEDSFSDLIRTLFVINGNHLIWGNLLFDKSGRRVSRLPFHFYAYDGIEFKDNFLIMAPGKAIILGKNCEILNEIEANGPKNSWKIQQRKDNY